MPPKVEASVALLVIGLLTVFASAIVMRSGAGLVKYKLAFRRSLKLAFVAATLIWGSLIIGVLVSEFMLPSGAAVYGIAGLPLLGLALALAVLRRGLQVSLLRAFVVWSLVVLVQGISLYFLAHLDLDMGMSGMAPQKRTIADIRSVGNASMAWLADHVSVSGRDGGASDDETEPNIDPQDTPFADAARYEVVPYDEVQRRLHPDDESFYMLDIPERDGWGHPLEYRFNLDNLLARRVLFIRSPGRDGNFETDRYHVGNFAQTDYDADIVWADGSFVRWPEKTHR